MNKNSRLLEMIIKLNVNKIIAEGKNIHFICENGRVVDVCSWQALIVADGEYFLTYGSTGDRTYIHAEDQDCELCVTDKDIIQLHGKHKKDLRYYNVVSDFPVYEWYVNGVKAVEMSENDVLSIYSVKATRFSPRTENLIEAFAIGRTTTYDVSFDDTLDSVELRDEFDIQFSITFNDESSADISVKFNRELREEKNVRVQKTSRSKPEYIV